MRAVTTKSNLLGSTSLLGNSIASCSSEVNRKFTGRDFVRVKLSQFGGIRSRL